MEVPATSLADLALTDQGQGMAEVFFALSPDDARRFEEMTGRLVGEQMRVSVCGEILAEPHVMLPIEGGQIVVTGGMDYMADLFAALKTADTCPGGAS